MSKLSKTSLNGWHTNTDLGCDVKTILRSDRTMKVGKDYQGVLRLEEEAEVDEFLSRDPHYTFIVNAEQRMSFQRSYLRDDGAQLCFVLNVP